MAATDQSYRNQYGLDIVFAVSSILMLLSIVWMLWDDYRREFKTEQRIFRDVEMAMAERDALRRLPPKAEVDAAVEAVKKAQESRNKNQNELVKLKADIQSLRPDKERKELVLSDFKADLDSKTSFYDIEVEHHGVDSPRAESLKKEIAEIAGKIVPAKNDVEQATQAIKSLQATLDRLEKPLTDAIGAYKKLLDDFDRQATLAFVKKWDAYDLIRTLPVLDAFNSPIRIEQITLHDLTIDYNFKGVTRFDRCMTCHKGIANANYSKENLQGLWYESSAKAEDRLADAQALLEQRKELFASLGERPGVLDSNKLALTLLSDKVLTPGRINEFCAHPRLELFVGPKSKHPAEKFGCTSCHSGQPSGTSFNFAAHTPNDSTTQKQWQRDHAWEAQHMWDFPMHPQRFVESSCLKCHHQVTDLFSDGNKAEAPKLIKGYNLVREFGCFGCHEINGYQGGRQIGPDLRLEPNTALEKLTLAERAKLFADPDNPPGTLNKVAPSLFRVSEKTDEGWAVKWIMAPREFRPDTKMPHYYGLSNNDAAALRGTGQEDFPATEVQGMVHYLFWSSRDYLSKVDSARNPNMVNAMQEALGRLQQKADSKQPLTDVEAKELKDAKYTLSLQGHPARLSDGGLKDGNAKTGRDLFTKKGCLACHSHAGTNEPDENWPAAPSDADFGPNLSQVKEKLLGKGGNQKKATLWLVNWLKNPTIHSPRSRMPITHLSDQEAADIAAWLLSQDVPRDAKGRTSEDLQGDKWISLDVPAPTQAQLESLAKVYLDRTLAMSEVKEFFANKLVPARISDLGADEQELAKMLKASDNQADPRRNALLHYVGKKAIGRLGCFGCHDIPGFESTKPIGTGLADWGKKDPTRLAFEDIVNYVTNPQHKYQIVDKLVDEDGYPRSVAKGPLYERFFLDALIHKSREGYLNQKILDPRSYDYERIRTWDDRSRMPQFQFARIKKKPAEDQLEFNQRKNWAAAVGKPLDVNAKPRSAESSADYLARKALEDAHDREAVMTFVLGLVGDPIPLQYLPKPNPDRLAEIKGRQVLDKFNCAGCHVVRPGTFEFRLSDNAKLTLQQFHGKNAKDEINKDDFFFSEHRAWNSPIHNGDTAVARGVRPILSAANNKPRLNFVLTDGLNVLSKVKDKPTLLDFRAKDVVSISADDFVWPPRSAFKSPDDFRAWEKQNGTQGGAFAALLSDYLNPEVYPDKKYSERGPYVPPLLTWQGERTNPEWLYQFLLDPQKVRELPVLRMPKFNLSQDEARILVDYFAGVEKRVNPEVNLVHPYSKIPQNADLNSDYWRSQTAKYIDTLKKNGLYDQEVKALKPIWNKMRLDWQAEAKNAAERLTTATAGVDKLRAEEASTKDQKKLAQIKKAIESAEADKTFWEMNKKDAENNAKNKTDQVLEDDWRQTEAYALAGYKLLLNQCIKCHAVGNVPAQQADGQGPSLNLAAQRLRPEWSFRWIANPQRFLPYVSAMPAYFKNGDKNPTGADASLVHWLPGPHLDQIGAARDAMLNLPRINELPLTRYWMQSGAK